MIEVTVAYAAGQGRTFTRDYYFKTHIPLFRKRMDVAMKSIRASHGIGGSTPASPAAFVAMVHATFDPSSKRTDALKSLTRVRLATPMLLFAGQRERHLDLIYMRSIPLGLGGQTKSRSNLRRQPKRRVSRCLREHHRQRKLRAGSFPANRGGG